MRKNGNKSKEKSFHKEELQYIEIQICHKFDYTKRKSSYHKANKSIDNHIPCFFDFFIFTDSEYQLYGCPGNRHHTENTRKRYKKCNDSCNRVTRCFTESRKNISWRDDITQCIDRKYRREKCEWEQKNAIHRGLKWEEFDDDLNESIGEKGYKHRDNIPLYNRLCFGSFFTISSRKNVKIPCDKDWNDSNNGNHEKKQLRKVLKYK